MLVWLVSATVSFRGHFFVLRVCVVIDILYLTSNKFSIIHACDKVGLRMERTKRCVETSINMTTK